MSYLSNKKRRDRSDDVLSQSLRILYFSSFIKYRFSYFLILSAVIVVIIPESNGVKLSD